MKRHAAAPHCENTPWGIDGLIEIIEQGIANAPAQHAAQSGELTWDTEKDTAESTAKVGELLQLIASVKEFQYC